jgi:hypothetical protein
MPCESDGRGSRTTSCQPLSVVFSVSHVSRTSIVVVAGRDTLQAGGGHSASSAKQSTCHGPSAGRQSGEVRLPPYLLLIGAFI